MKIVIPAKNNNLEAEVDVSLGRCEYFLIYDLDKSEEHYIENTAKNAQGGAGVLAGQLLVDSGCDALITRRCGIKAGQVLDGAGILVYKAVEGSLKENIDKFREKELAILEERSKEMK